MNEMPDNMDDLSAEEKRSLLASLLREQTEQHTDIPLSFAQRRLWFLNQFESSRAAYNSIAAWQLTGPLERQVLERSLNEIVQRHQVLRSTFPLRNGQIQQVVAESLKVSLHTVDLSLVETAAANVNTAIQSWLSQEIQQTFDLTTDLPVRMSLLQLGPLDHVLVITMHHIVSDGWSMSVLSRELGKLYNAYLHAQPSPLAPLPLQYADYAARQLQELEGPQLQSQLDYWKQRLINSPTLLQLPTDRPRPAVESFAGARHPVSFSQPLLQGLKSLSQTEQATLFMTLLAAFNVLLYRYTNQDDIVVGCPMAGRNRSDVEGLIGFFVNTLTLRTDLSGPLTFRELIARVREAALGAYAHQDLPFERLVEELHPDRDTSHNPVFQVMFGLQNTPSETLSLAQLDAVSVEVPWHSAKVDLTMLLEETATGIEGFIEYNTDLFDAQTIERLHHHLQVLLNDIIADPDQPITQLSLLTASEREQQLIEWNRTATDYPRDKTVHELFEVQVAATPDAVAIEYEGDALSYAQLNKQANQLAHYLQAMGVGPEVMVGISVERSLEMVIGMLGILKAGGAYVPLDPDYPQSRLAFMLEDTQAQILLTLSCLDEKLPSFSGDKIYLDTDWSAIDRESTDNPDSAASANSLMYVIYTSGSTGLPKGTTIEHRSAVRLVKATNYVELGCKEVFLQFAPISFDASTFELWGCLLNGAKMHIFPAGHFDLHELGQFIQDKGISTLWLTSALFSQMVDNQLSSLTGVRQLLAGGEALSLPHVKKMLDHLGKGRLINGYGPTENTTFTCCHVMTRASQLDQSVPIGRPISNTRVYILDKQMQPVPVGIPGELYIGGDGLARGYLNQPELTAEKFVADPFSADAKAKLYRTGDSVRYRGDGSIEFIGRIDHQVKIRGFRIELGEIEALLAKQEQVKHASVIMLEDAPGEKRLVAYVVVNKGSDLTSDTLRQHLRVSLPDYMVPSAFVLLDALPLTPNGKVDRDALPVPQQQRQVEGNMIAPRGELEQRIADIWRELLHQDEVGIRDNFFDLGGHSLLLIEIQARLSHELDRDISVLSLFEYPTIEALASHLGEQHDAPAPLQAVHDRSSRCHERTTGSESIAIIGMSGRFPGAADIDTFWQNLCDGVDALQVFSDEELRAASVSEDNIRDPAYVRSGIVLDNVDMFDARFFGYTPREAEIIDPQQRLFLECATEVLETAGYAPGKFDGSIGVIAGVSKNTYASQISDHGDLPEGVDDVQLMIAGDKDFLSTRVSYKLNLTGPGITVQTACSTSLVAVHLAIQSLLNNECDMALAGGASIKLPMKTGYLYNPAGIQSPDGKCRAFDQHAGGSVRGHGIAIVLLKRLDEALQDGDNIWAVIKGSAINNDGSHKIGYTAPGIEGQAKVISMAQNIAGVEPESISYVEAHGTGTPLGDPIELKALTRAFNQSTDKTGFCAIGSIKTNIGHLDAAAGATGLIKTTLALRHKQLPPTLHFTAPNPEIDFEHSPFRVNTSLTPWEGGALPRRAGVSSFGMGGTNAHVVLEEAPVSSASSDAETGQLLLLSAKTNTALDKAMDNLADYLQAHPDINLADVAYTLQLGREDYSCRQAVVCDTAAQAVTYLQQRSGWHSDNLQQDSAAPSIVFMFTGQGSQYPNMGLELYRKESVFRETVDQCCDLLQATLGLDLRQILYPSQDQIDDSAAQLKRTSLTQPALFVTEYALARLWMAWGIQPEAMIGHSIGEYVAACLAEVFTLEDALQLVAERGRLMDALPAGAMLSVPLSEEQTSLLLEGALSLATVNGPGLCVVSGPEDEITALQYRLEEQQLGVRRLHTSHAFHSPMMQPAVAPFIDYLSSISLQAPRRPFISNLSGSWITDAQATDPTYWASQLRQCVRFGDGIAELFRQPERLLLEIGPGRTLSTLAGNREDRPEQTKVIASLPAPQEQISAGTRIRETLGRLWIEGLQPNWQAVHEGRRQHRIPLPTYPFERQRYWLDAHSSQNTPRVQPGRKGVADWFYLPSWRRSLRATVGNIPSGMNWLLFVTPDASSQVMVDRIASTGSEIVQVSAGTEFRQHSVQQYTIRPHVAADYQQLVDSLREHNALPDRLVHLWAASVTEAINKDDAGNAVFEPALDAGFFSVLQLIQSLVNVDADRAWDISVITTGAHEVFAGDRLSPSAATIQGLGKVLALENPGVQFRSIDVSDTELSAAGNSIITCLLTEIATPDAESVIAYRGGQRWLPDLEPVKLQQPDEVPARLKKSGVYIIIGGLGGVGLAIAEYLAQAVDARLVLTSRNEFISEDQWQYWLDEHDEDNAVSQRILRLKSLQQVTGEKVEIHQASVEDEYAMRSAFTAAQQKFGSVDGVIHAAGAEKHGQLIQAATREHCSSQFVPKIQGLQVLAKVVHEQPLDFCLLCSSLSSFLGVGGFVAYTAAHLYMDAFAVQQNQASSIPWITVNWDNWNIQHKDADQVTPGLAQYMMTMPEAQQALARIFSTNALYHVAVSTGDLKARLQQWQQSEPELLEPGSTTTASSSHSGHARPALASEYQPPVTEAEKMLVEQWQRHLGIDGIGIDDNFFELGGDSMINIQIIAKANQAGLSINPKHVFEYQTIRELAAIASQDAGLTQSANPAVEQGMVTGVFPATPIMQWFLDQDMVNPNHFNQARMLTVTQPLKFEIIKQAVAALIRHHDILRLRYNAADSVQAFSIVKDETSSLVNIDLSACSQTDLVSRIESEAAKCQANLDITQGPVLSAAYFNLGEDRAHKLCIVIHHLATDAVSWRILLEDFTTACHQLNAGKAILLPNKTTSFKAWSRVLLDYAHSNQPAKEFDYWSALSDRQVVMLPLDRQQGINSAGSTDRVTAVLDPEKTRQLLQQVSTAASNRVMELLLTALAQSIVDWTGESSVYIDMEGHGRDIEVVGQVDISRTTGWFTTLYPVYLELDSTMDTSMTIQSVAEQFHSIPSGRAGYGILKYLSSSNEMKQRMREISSPEIIFLYQGRVDDDLAADEKLLLPASESAGPFRDPAIERQHKLEINTSIKAGQLEMNWTYSRNLHHRETIEELAHRYMEKLSTIVSDCQVDNATAVSTENFSAKNMKQDDLDKIMKRLQYPRH